MIHHFHLQRLITAIVCLLVINGCANYNSETQPSSPPPKIEHKYFTVGDTVTEFSYDYTINSVKEANDIPAREGNKWIVLDVTFKDNSGQEDQYQTYASMYGEFILVDDEKYIYKSYNKEQRTEFYGSTRDFILFLVPSSKKDFILFDEDFSFDDWSDFDTVSRNIVKINL